jgi:hypothetical protein
MVSADDAVLLGNNYHKKNTEALIDASKEVDLEVTQRNQNAGQNHDVKFI